MIIPNLRIIVPVVVVVVLAAGYVIIAKPFGGNNQVEAPENTGPTAEEIQSYRIQASEFLAAGKYKEALELLLKLETLTPEDVVVHYSVARLYQSANLKAEALAALGRGVPYLGDNAEAKAAYDAMFAELNDKTPKFQ